MPSLCQTQRQQKKVLCDHWTVTLNHATVYQVSCLYRHAAKLVRDDLWMWIQDIQRLGVNHQRNHHFISCSHHTRNGQLYLQVDAKMWELYFVSFDFWMLILFCHIYSPHMSSIKEWKGILRSRQKGKGIGGSLGVSDSFWDLGSLSPVAR
jgi:hypothetical protein